MTNDEPHIPTPGSRQAAIESDTTARMGDAIYEVPLISLGIDHRATYSQRRIGGNDNSIALLPKGPLGQEGLLLGHLQSWII